MANGNIDPVSDTLARRMAAFDRGVEALSSVPGVDPALDLVEHNGRNVPAAGYLVRATVTPGFCGVIELIRYDHGLWFRRPTDQRMPGEEGGTIIAMCDAPDSSGYVMSYEPAGATSWNVEPIDRWSPTTFTGSHWDETNLIDLAGRGRLLDERGGFRPRVDITTGVTHTDLSKAKGQLIATARYDTVRQDRVAAGPEELFSILARYGASMGMEPQDIEVLVNTARTHTYGIEPAHDISTKNAPQQPNGSKHQHPVQMERSKPLASAARHIAQLFHWRFHV